MPDDAAVLQAVLRHVLHRLLEAEEAVPTQGRWVKRTYCSILGMLLVGGGVGSSSRLRSRAR